MDGRRSTQARAIRQGADPAKVNWLMTELILFIMVIYVTMVYGPIAAFLVEMFPTKIRYTSMSLPYHIGNGWFGGMLPLLATAIVAAYGDIYFGLWYPIVVALMTVVVGSSSCAIPRVSTSPPDPAWPTKACRLNRPSILVDVSPASAGLIFCARRQISKASRREPPLIDA